MLKEENLQVFMRYPGGRPKALTLSYDDGVEQDITLIEKMQTHGVKGTFNINSGIFAPEGTIYPAGRVHRRMTERAIVDLLKDSGMEVAVHTLTHPRLETLSAATVLEEVIGDRRNLEALFGRPVLGMAYPYGTYNDTVVEALRMAGILYSRTTEYHESFRQPKDWLRLKATCHHNNPHLMELTGKFVAETPKFDPYLFYLWGHSYEFEGNDNWHVMDAFLDAVSGKDDVWYATNLEIYQYTKAFEQLVFSVDYSFCYNPTATTVWLKAKERIVEVPAGETISLLV